MSKKEIPYGAAAFWAGIIARAWEDDKFKRDLIQDPEQTLAKLGYGDFTDSNGQKITIQVSEATSSATCEYDANSLTLTLFIPETPDCLGSLQLNSSFTAGLAPPC